MEKSVAINIKYDNLIRSRKYPVQTHIDFRSTKTVTPVKEEKELTEIVCLTSYPPRECGIATYSKDLLNALTDKFIDTFKLIIYPLESRSSNHQYTEEVESILNTDLTLDFLKVAQQINNNTRIGLVVIQHEFGLFSNNEKSFYDFLESLNKPIVITYHTVLPNPTTELREKVLKISSLSSQIIVMTQSASKTLEDHYNIPKGKINVISHGTHLTAYGNKETLKEKHNLEGKTVLSTFGLLGPGKSIETTLHALPQIIKRFPEAVFLILGRTHPNLVKESGETYRNFLKDRVAALGIGNHVRFVDQFIPIADLLEYLKLTDIYLFTSKDPYQAVSGTFAYALSSGCPIISTPIPHAVEVLKNGAGSLFDFENSDQLQAAVIDLLNNDAKRSQMSLNGLHTSLISAWENAAIAHAQVFTKALQMPVKLKFRKPPIDLKHIKNMTTNIGIIQFSRINQPDIESGYTLDDNARALIAICKHYELTGDSSDLKYIKTYFNFVFCCFRHDCRFLNYVDKEYQFTDQNETVNLEDACGRAIWALGYVIYISWRLPEEFKYIRDKAIFVFKHAVEALETAHSPRAIAFIIKGLYFYNKFEERECINEKVINYANRLVEIYKHESEEDWHWYESYLTYGNSVLPHSLLMAYSMTLKPEYRKIAKKSFNFLLSKIFVDDTISVISNQNWHRKGEPLCKEFKGGEQPIDVAYTILALRYFHKLFPENGYHELMENAFNWFMGKNPLGLIIYNPSTGGCHDGLEKTNVNLNQGAESTISYLLARMAFENLEE
ncbi:glycosyltransferase [Arenibacter certesii]|uniref:Glycosyl transferase n=1 Tax=Arenibacter certesii TaxID=228955 RepID=A0A918J1P3_9FLAO|nr:glycosyltransferase [Arenibacter certesii]GGW42435.1 glycosyl transferase [Arenibacter certesii]